MFERIYEARKHLIESIEFKLNTNNYMNKPLGKRASSHKFILIGLVFALISCTIGYVLVQKYLKLRRAQKLNSNYSNLIESEFDT